MGSKAMEGVEFVVGTSGDDATVSVPMVFMRVWG